MERSLPIMVTTLTDVNRSFPADFREISGILAGLITPASELHLNQGFSSSDHV
jgi:hypothetical protein